MSFIRNLTKNDSIHHIYFIGESNSGGEALNSEANSSELDVNQNVKIWRNINNDGFENLDIGTNNLLGHFGMSDEESSTYHGWELQLSNIADSYRKKPIYITKCGQGGSRIDQWNVGGDYWSKFILRSDGSKKALSNTRRKTTIWITIGINDAIAGTDTTVWYNNMYTWIENINTQTKADSMVITRLMENTSAKLSINEKIDSLVENIEYLFSVDTQDATLKNTNHWDYSGMKVIANRMWNLTR